MFLCRLSFMSGFWFTAFLLSLLSPLICEWKYFNSIYTVSVIKHKKMSSVPRYILIFNCSSSGAISSYILGAQEPTLKRTGKVSGIKFHL